MIVKHFTGTEYLKTLDTVGNVSPTAHDLPGKIKRIKMEVLNLIPLLTQSTELIRILF